MSKPRHKVPGRVIPLWVGAVWFLLALLVGKLGLLGAAPAGAVQLTILVLTALTLVFFRRWAMGLEIQHLLLFHTTRLVGLFFIYLYSRGRLPYEFAIPAGWGDILVAAAVPVVLMLNENWLIQIWNALGMADILFVVITASRLTMQNAGSMRELTHLPLSLLPTFLVPLIIASHVVIALQARSFPRRTDPAF